MTDVWMVAMGIGENVSERNPTRVFSTKEAAFAWVIKHFKEDIKNLSQCVKYYENGVTIGNSFAIRKIQLEGGEAP